MSQCTITDRPDGRHYPSVKVVFRPIVLTIGLLLLGTTANAQQSEQEIFSATDSIRSSADEAGAALLSPENYSRAIAEYDRARNALEKGKSLSNIESSLAIARNYFQQSITNTEIATAILSAAIDSRAAAEKAEAERLAPQYWIDGEKQFIKATRALEKGDEQGADQYNTLADELFRAAELNAFRTQYFSEARRLIAEAEQNKVGKLAPRTLNRAKELLREADAALTESRYQTDTPKRLAGQASYEARHAIYIASLVKEVNSGTRSIEEVVLDWELPLTEIAGVLEIDPDMTAGYSDTKKRVVKSLHQLLALNGELAERDRLIAGLEEELRELDAQLGGASAERVALVRRLEHQKRVREQFALVASMFTPEEAQILRDGDQLIIRLVGLSFASNSSKIDPESAILMNKVEDAIDIFPRCELMIEGHTDSQGKAERNLELSISRAQSVMNFMNEEMRIPIYRMRASGYGDTRPISNNKTVEGRAKNRRIDLIIIPNIDNL